MSDSAAARPLFNPSTADAGGTGLLPFQTLREMIRQKEIQAQLDIESDQVQPASLDLRLGATAYRVRASFLPGPNARVIDKINQFGMHEIDLSKGAVLERGCVYIVQLMEWLKLGPRLSGVANPKSSTGRLDIFVRLITDRAAAFDHIPAGYEGPLYAEIAPRSFSVLVHTGTRLNQLRLRRGSQAISDTQLKRLHDTVPLIDAELDRNRIREGGIALTLDLQGDPETGLVGYRAKKHTAVIDIAKRDYYDPLEFWDPIHRRAGAPIFLNPDDFYILATKEAVTIPPDHAAEMVAYDTMIGEFRVHYAGFFDPGFGFHPEGGGTKAVLEVRSHEVPFILEQDQMVGWLRYEKLASKPDRVYGYGIGSSYQRQGLTLSKQFRPYAGG